MLHEKSKLQKYVHNIIPFLQKVCVCVFSCNWGKIQKGMHQTVHGDHLRAWNYKGVEFTLYTSEYFELLYQLCNTK